MIRWIASSRIRLALTSVALLALLFVGGAAGADYVWNDSTSHTTNLLFLLGCAFALLGFGAAFSTLVGDLVFPNRWRERVILGKRMPAPADEDLESPETVRGMKTYLPHFSALFVIAMALGGFGFDRATDGFFTRYQRFGSLRTTLRSDDTAGKIDSLKKLSGERRENRIRSIIEVIDMAWRDPRQPAEVQTAALEALGTVVMYLSDAIDSWMSEGREDSWQGSLYSELRTQLAPDLRASRATATEARRVELIAMSGLLRDRDSEPELIANVANAKNVSAEVWRASAIALGRMRSFAAYEAVIPLGAQTLDDAAYDAVAWATQALAREYHKGRPDLDENALPEREARALELAVKIWGPQLVQESPERRCIAAMVALHLRDSRMRDPLIAGFDKPGAGAILCQSAPVEVGLGRKDYLAGLGFLQKRIVDALALVSLGDADVKAWVKSRLSNSNDLDASVKALLADLGRHLGI